MIASLILVFLPATFLTVPPNSNQSSQSALESRAHQSNEARADADLSLKAMRQRVIAARPLAMYYTTGGTFGVNSIQQHASDMTILSPQCFWLDQNASIHGSIPARMMEAARQSGLPVMPLLYNRDFNRRVASQVLRNGSLQKAVISQLAEIVRNENLLGFQLDFENVDPDDVNLYT